ncbi:IclR family transcriptional regulator [Aliiruegeria haliotis]|uniref:IclR family transcriptional regulator n=1 Tax=Aliiruegeria haliotis TaxID=1280846 RepID=A0A2T0RN77_9RHOB|nr:IclR family transcriptional regulator [Aliiruegeria haliotis]PRY22608.1 IclR family transcriptional regulator [Aliiruegeria haliotis]
MASTGDGTVGKALDVLDLVAAQEKPVRFADLQRMSPLPKATLYRLAQTLVNQGMLVQDPSAGTYTLGVRLVRLAHAAWRQASLAPIARRHVDILCHDTGLTVHLAQMDHGHVLYVDKRTATGAIRMSQETGKVAPAYCTAVGKAMMAFMPEGELAGVIKRQSFHRFTPTTLTNEVVLRAALERARSRGYARDREEHEPGMICVAAPILIDGARVLGAVGLTGSTLQVDFRQLEGQLPRLHQCVEDIAGEAVHWSYPVEGEGKTEGRLG